MTDRPLVWLFDVDGTLLTTENAGRMALAAGLREHYGIDDDLTSIPMAGRTDPLILGDAMRKHGIAPDGEADRAALWAAILGAMERLMTPPRGRLLPGVHAVLDHVDARPGWVPALLTGNVREMARLKLGAFGIWERFRFGAFGDDAADRDGIARVAVARAAAACGVPPSRCVVVGDTELDIACARAAGAHAVAVATGGRTRAQLAPHAPDLLLDDLADPAPLVDWAAALD